MRERHKETHNRRLPACLQEVLTSALESGFSTLMLPFTPLTESGKQEVLARLEAWRQLGRFEVGWAQL